MKNRKDNTMRFQCCFCGQTIENYPPDPCGIGLTANFTSPAEKQQTQGLFCHMACFEERMYDPKYLYLRALVEEEHD